MTRHPKRRRTSRELTKLQEAKLALADLRAYIQRERQATIDRWSTRRNQLEENRRQLVAYLTMKMIDEDWHGVADAAMDLRELDAELRIVRTLC